jgi:hypothetical protein
MLPGLQPNDALSVCSSFSQQHDEKLRNHKVSVSFPSEAAVVHEFERISDEERGDIWYTAEEYKFIKLRDYFIIELKKVGTFQESEQHTFRGLERRMKRHLLKKLRASAVAAVLLEQRLQKVRLEILPDLIAEVYKEAVGTKLGDIARRYAQRDAQDAWSGGGSEEGRSNSTRLRDATDASLLEKICNGSVDSNDVFDLDLQQAKGSNLSVSKPRPMFRMRSSKGLYEDDGPTAECTDVIDRLRQGDNISSAECIETSDELRQGIDSKEMPSGKRHMFRMRSSKGLYEDDNPTTQHIDNDIASVSGSEQAYLMPSSKMLHEHEDVSAKCKESFNCSQEEKNSNTKASVKRRLLRMWSSKKLLGEDNSPIEGTQSSHGPQEGEGEGVSDPKKFCKSRVWVKLRITAAPTCSPKA